MQSTKLRSRIAVALDYPNKKLFSAKVLATACLVVPMLSWGSDTTTVVNEEDMVLVVDGGFWIDTHEVTNAAYARFILETRHRVPAPTDSGLRLWNSWKDGKPRVGFERYPVVGVDWWEAEAYCGWMDKRLPSEAEWERACQGLVAFPYPWGETAIDREHANYDPTGRSRYGTVEVGSLPKGASPYGAMEMVGNVWEWTTNKGVLRGGAWNNTDGLVRCTGRYRAMPASRDHAFGFRCAKERQPQRH